MKWLVVTLSAVQCLHLATAARILALCTVISHSHSLWCYQYLAALADRGHQITVFGVDEPHFKIANLTKFIAKGIYEETFSDLGITDWVGDSGKPGLSGMYPGFNTWNELSSAAILHSKTLQDLINHYKGSDKPFDLIIHDNVNADAVLGLVPLFGNPPLVLATTFGSPQWMNFRAGNIFHPAYVPSMVSSSGQYMTFYERLQNVYEYLYMEWFTSYLSEPFQNKLLWEIFGDHLPPVSDIVKQANIVIVNHHFALDDPRPMLPGVVGIAGLHITEPKPLPEDIQSFMDKAEHGVILMGFGSNVDSNWLPSNFENIVVSTLGKLPQRVLWKWNNDIPNLPENIKISQWLPQGDILAHPNIRLFISHCGLLSTQEAVYRRVPVLALPVFVDQFSNAAMLVRRNVGVRLNAFKLNAEQFHEGVNEVLSNPLYKTNIDKLGELMVDMPQTAKQQAVFWTEYVIRHQGAAHLHSAAADLPWYQLLFLDIIAAILLIIFLVVWSLKNFLSRVFKKNIQSLKKKAE